jgi:predicted nuclease of predicted toxin-antitoxin system
MKVLFDKGVPVRLRRALPALAITTVQELGWDELANGDLLTQAQDEYDVLISTDSNIKYQQNLPDYNIALIILRAFNTKLESYLPLVPEIELAVQNICPGDVVYLYADPKLAALDARKGHKTQ